MSYSSRILTAVLCTMAFTATCVAQSDTSFKVVSTSEATGTYSGWTPQAIYAVDMNGDGIPDLIQNEGQSASGGAYSPTGQFGISIANGDGTFKPAFAVNYPPGVSLAPMAFGDFNGDGKIDIAMPIPGKNTLAIYLGYGNGTFASPWYFNLPLSAGQTLAQFAPLVAADFNHDGKMDLAVVGVDNTNTTVYILPGEGNGVFSTAQPILTAPTGINSTRSAVLSMFTGDYDSDGNPDLAVATTVGNSEGGFASMTVHVLYGEGDFSFEDTTPWNNGPVLSLGSGDLNSDGYTDLYGLDSNSYRIDTFYGQPGRSFATYTTTIPAASYVSSLYMPALAMADFNDDGRMDLVTNVTENGLVYMVFFLATPDLGQFDTQTWNITTDTDVVYNDPPVVGDFNHDTKPDFALVNYITGGDGDIYTGLNTSTAGLWSDCNYPTAARGIMDCSPVVSSGSTVNFNATANSFGQLRKIELWVDGKKLDEQHHTWEGKAWFNYSSTLAAGTHQGTYFAADVDNTLQQYNFTFTVPSACSAPTSAGVHICTPSNGAATASGQVTVSATSTITGTLARMEIWIDSTKQYTETNSTSLSAGVQIPAGKHTITVFAVNTSGTVWEQAASVTVP